MARPTLVFVHAHPDDEAFFGAGAAAHYAALGCRVILVTCTYGQLGFDLDGRMGLEAGHDDAEVRSVRAAELQRSAFLLGFSRVVTLGYDDSGMTGWPNNANPHAFMNADVDAVATILAAILNEERAAVVLTYNEFGFYGHPDHIMANVVTRRALEWAPSVERLYYPIVPKGLKSRFIEGADQLGLSLPHWVIDADTTTDDELVATTLDVSELTATKQKAMAAHDSQIDNADLVGMKSELFAMLFGTEYYQRAWSRVATDADRTDLLGGLTWD